VEGLRSQRYVLPETVALAAVALADLLYTCYLLATGTAYEGNPLMAAMLRAWGPNGFVAAKALLVGLPLAVAEVVRSRHPRFVQLLLRLALGLYLIVWLAALVQLSLGG